MYEEIIEAYVKRTFYDPYSLRDVSISQPIQGHILSQQGWIVCFEANAKNRMGGYVGIQRGAYLINRDSVVQTWANAPLCNDTRFQYSPLPELEQVQ
ncbi:MAG TPA: hypothetical protein VJ327_09720 [Patescibacteria group bacterium]|nr:hypothetical protein [Patescibacteria group bacterium]